MTMREASEQYQIPIHILEEYENWGLCGAVKKIVGSGGMTTVTWNGSV